MLVGLIEVICGIATGTVTVSALEFEEQPPIGSVDPEHFSADMGTDLLDRLGEVVSQKVRMLHWADA